MNRFSRLAMVASFVLVLAAGYGVAKTRDAQPNKAAIALPERVTFNAHVRPIMSGTCFACHGPDADGNLSGYRLDTYENATGPLESDDERVGIVPGDKEASEVFLRITGQSDGEQMPPEEFHHQLSERDKAVIGRWIDQGAEYEQHWSYTPVTRPESPELEQDADWIANPVDGFILAKLQSEGLRPSPRADKATLLRRLSLDLIGLPPTVEEVQAFLADESPDAYQKHVDRLLASPHYGERMAAFWLDLVRFADTVGFHGDQNQRIFPYRDYVIDAFNDNKPFDEFTREQLAGDLLAGPNGEEPTEEQLVATGFLRLNMMTREGGAQPGEYLAKYRADRVRALGTAWLGSTLACCECHNHKYDPYTIKDFYSLGAFFDSVRQWGVYADYGYTPNPELRGFNNNSPFPPEVRAESPSLTREIQYEQRVRDDLMLDAIGLDTLKGEAFAAWRLQLANFLTSHPDGWTTPAIAESTSKAGAELKQLENGSLLAKGGAKKDDIITVELSAAEAMMVNALRVEVLPHAEHGGRVGRSGNGRFNLRKLEVNVVPSDDGDSQPIGVAWAQADRQYIKNHTHGRDRPDVKDGWQSGPGVWQLPSNEASLPHTAIYHLERPVQLAADQKLQVKLHSDDVGCVRLSATPLAHAVPGWPAADETSAEALNASPEDRSREQQAMLVSAFHRATTPFKQQAKASQTSRDTMLKLRAGKAISMIAQELPEEKIPVSRVLPRGNWQDDSGELTPPAFPDFLPKSVDQQSQRRLNRLDLANWVASPDNPLTSRHVVNRTWKQFFGVGLSGKLDDLGNQGEWPSHPQLLDWLASEFVESGWDVKHIVRLMVTSSTYQQAAAVRDDLKDIDPYNRLLAQQAARRLEAEVIRDNALSIAGLLRADYVGGPSVFPYQPAGHYKNLQFPGRQYVSSKDWRQYRRGVYMHWQRTFLHPMLVNFDAPSRDECTADRSLSNSPQQALTLLNDPSFVEASHAFAAKLLRDNGDVAITSLIDAAYLRAVSRRPSEAEKAGLVQLFEKQEQYYGENPTDATKLLATGLTDAEAPADPAKLAALTQVCRVILNLHETITRF